MKDEDMDIVLKLMNSTQKSFTFVLDGSLFKGTIASKVKQYVNEKSDKKFRTWLIDKGLLIDDSFDEDYIEPERVNKLI